LASGIVPIDSRREDEEIAGCFVTLRHAGFAEYDGTEEKVWRRQSIDGAILKFEKKDANHEKH